MTPNHLTTSRRGFLTLAGAGATLALAGCGSGSVASSINPKHIYVLGDGFCDVGQTGTMATVNDGTLNWVQQLASYYGLKVEPAAKGGTGYAQYHAYIDSPDTVSGFNAPSVAQQVQQLLASTKFEDDDLVMVNGGMYDLVDLVSAYGVNDEVIQQAKALGQKMGKLVRYLVDSGVKRVIVTGVYDLSVTPWGRRSGYGPTEGFDKESPLTRVSNAFNGDGLKVEIVDLGANVLFFDAADFFDFLNDKPENFSLDNAVDPVCTTPTALTCTPETVVKEEYNRYLYADDLHFTPENQRKFVSESYSRNVYSVLKNRW